MIDKRVAALWPAANGLDVLGLGHADALLDRFRGGARRVISAAPSMQGAERWPAEGASLTTLVEDERLPFPDALFDRIIVCHALEEAESPNRLLREIWRVAAPEARILIIVAHRRGLWARAESTPFGHGRPYTRTQLNPPARRRDVCTPGFGPGALCAAHRLGNHHGGGRCVEKIGRFAWSGFGGVLMIEAMKRLHIQPGKAVPGRAGRPGHRKAVVSRAERKKLKIGVEDV